ncbi:siphovirus Gp157 family protein [Desulfonatronum thioautotrophicum]|uniref:siphovirus Gp157 family protein n=1 Tax=Desulfonatronum thioautotrophicum TaxID=617001 RepID=UPI0005EAFED9|nr:siphovirus Gp157 family protein [Desulfonatronum thioautotrophicum]
MTNLIGIEEEISNILQAAEELSEGEQELALSYLDQLAIQEAEKIDAISFAVRKRQTEIDFLKSEEERLRNRRKAMEIRLFAFREHLTGIFKAQGLQKVKGIKSTLFMRKSSSVEIVDLRELPSQFVETRIEYVPRKTQIKDEIKKGQVVPGAQITERQSLVIN